MTTSERSERDVVAALRRALTERIGERRYTLWFLDKTKITRRDEELVVGVPNHFYQDWLQKTFADAVRLAAAEVFHESLRVSFTIDPELFQAARREEQAPRLAPPAGAAAPRARRAAPQSDPDDAGECAGSERRQAPSAARRWRPLNEFVVGPCNRVAHAAALSVVEEPGQSANPLVLHGPVGTGKTHLLEGIYLGLRQREPSWRIVYVTAEQFTNRFVQAMRLGKLSSFRKQFRECDALLFDDLQFLATKRATQEEFLHTFDALVSEHRQLALTCDCHPRLADGFLPELADRLVGGAVWSLLPPDADTRRQLLQFKALRSPLGPLPNEVADFLAQQLRCNVRELEGALHSVAHYRRVTERPLDVGLVREALAELLRHSVRLIQLPEIDQAVCRALRLPNGTLQSKDRSWCHAQPRMLAMYLARKHTTASYTEVGRFFGGRTHSTAVAAEKKVRQWLQDDTAVAVGENRLRVRDLLDRIEAALLR